LTYVDGAGAPPAGNGIELVRVGGTSSSNAFTLDVAGSRYIDAGAYRYRLFNGPVTGTDANWYLRSQSSPGEPEYRPEVPWLDSLPGLLRQSDLDLLGTLHRRVGDDLRGTENDHRLWARVFGSDAFTLRQPGAAPSEAKGRNWGFQGGIDLYQSRNAQNRRNDVGIVAGKVNTTADISSITGASRQPVGRLSTDASSVGAYWTFKSAGGFYFDLVGQKIWYGGDGYSLDDQGNRGIDADVRGDGYAVSLEAGQQFKVSSRWLLEPQAQIIRHGVRLKDIDLPGMSPTTVSFGQNDSTVGRLGLRLVGEYGVGGNHPFTPYLRANWWHGFDGNYQTSFGTSASSSTLNTSTGYDSGEVGAGFTVALNENVSLYSEVDHRFAMGSSASANSHGIAGSIGVRIGFGASQASARQTAPVSQTVAPPVVVPPQGVTSPPVADSPQVTAPPQAAQAAPVRVTLSADALFDFNSTELRAVGRNSLDGLVRDMGGVQYELVLIGGHTDRLGSDVYNQQLSERRANAVRDYLVGRGVPASNIRATGYGKSQPVTKPDQCVGPKSPELIACLQPDRRVDVQINGVRQP
jgi:outer membrane autotransporter protein